MCDGVHVYITLCNVHMCAIALRICINFIHNLYIIIGAVSVH